MAKKDVIEYYNQVCNQYSEMMDTLRDFEKESMEGLYPPEKLESIKQTLEPLKQNYQRISWIIFLLNKPRGKLSQKLYQRRNQKLLKSLNRENSKEGVVAENDKVIMDLKEQSFKK